MVTPGSYLTAQRRTAGLSLDEITLFFAALGISNRLVDASYLAAIEADDRRACTIDLMALRLAYDFRPSLYRQLCAAGDAQANISTPAERTASHG